MSAFNCYGHMAKGAGLANAYAMHAEALSAFVDCNLFGLDGAKENGVLNTYYHANPAKAGLVQTPGRNVAFWVCESTELQDVYHRFEGRFTDIWTASSFCQNVLQEELQRPVKLIPHCIRSFNYRPTKGSVPVCMVAFDGNSRIARKNPWGSVEAIKQAFGNDCYVVVKAKNLQPSYKAWIEQQLEGVPHVLINQYVSDEELQKLYAKVDILVSLHTAEGFGLHLLEAMAHGVKVVATGATGNLDFMDESNSWLVGCDEEDVTDEFFKGRWFQPDIEDATEKLRDAANAEFKKCERAFDTALAFSMENTISKTRKALEV